VPVGIVHQHTYIYIPNIRLGELDPLPSFQPPTPKAISESVMHWIPFAALISALFTASALAGHNCKCQDANGQYDDLTKACCKIQWNTYSNWIYYPGANHQCTCPFNSINDGVFVECCVDNGVGGAYCW